MLILLLNYAPFRPNEHWLPLIIPPTHYFQFFVSHRQSAFSFLSHVKSGECECVRFPPKTSKSWSNPMKSFWKRSTTITWTLHTLSKGLQFPDQRRVDRTNLMVCNRSEQQDMVYLSADTAVDDSLSRQRLILCRATKIQYSWMPARCRRVTYSAKCRFAFLV